MRDLNMDQEQNQCPFCHFINNATDELYLVGETENFYAWLEAPEPRAKGQANVIPKDHVESVLEFSPEEWSEAMTLLREVMEKIMEGLEADGISVTMNVKEAGGQMVPHAYIQIFPRYEEAETSGTPTGAIFPQNEELASEEMFEEIHQKMQSISPDFGVETVEPHPESQRFREEDSAEGSESSDEGEEETEEDYRPERGESIEWM
jgi:diadenosine tetraphosphate (Ap4A) HIT family hydrolase